MNVWVRPEGDDLKRTVDIYRALLSAIADGCVLADSEPARAKIREILDPPMLDREGRRVLEVDEHGPVVVAKKGT